MTINGFKGKEKEVISSIYMTVDNGKSNIEFNMVYKKQAEKFDKMELALMAKGQLLAV